MSSFDGKKRRDVILKDLKDEVLKMGKKPTLAVFLIGNDPACKKYVEIKEKFANQLGIEFCLYRFDATDSEEDILSAIDFLNKDFETDGIMIQIPTAKKFDRDRLIKKIDPKKDVDGLQFCLLKKSAFLPPVVLAILDVLKNSGKDLTESKIALIGSGFLVGAPLQECLEKEYRDIDLRVVSKEELAKEDFVLDADIVISAAGSANIVKEKMVKEGVVLIDAGTACENGEVLGDIEKSAYAKAALYTPVPGGIGPLTIAMLFKNLIKKNDKSC